MKRMIFATGLALAFVTASAQTESSSYIVKTKGAKKAVVTTTSAEGEQVQQEEEKAHDFISENFKFYSLCDWQEGMKFMVMPEKYDMVVKTFADAATGKEVSSMALRHKIMIYKGHNESSDGHSRVNFLCQDDNKLYYYEIPSGSFDDYCYGKLGVPTLAYLGDVDIAREKLIGKKLFTQTTLYRIDTEYDGDGFKEVTVGKNEEVTVTAIGVGTRNYPVKIIVEDEKGNEFYQNVAISKTNSGMRDDEFIMDNAKFLFAGSFELQDAVMELSRDYASYINKTVHTKFGTTMLSEKNRMVKLPRQSEFTIEAIQPHKTGRYVTMTLRDNSSSARYQKDVTFVNENVAGDIDGYSEDYFAYLFAMGPGKLKETSQAARAAIRQGRVILRMSEDEVAMAVGEPERTVTNSDGSYQWYYTRSQGKILEVLFASTGKVVGTKVLAGTSGQRRVSTVRKKTTTTARKKTGTPIRK